MYLRFEDPSADTIVLTAGTYWLKMSASGSLASGPWMPEVSYATEAEMPSPLGNALQYISNTVEWKALEVALPFQIFGVVQS